MGKRGGKRFGHGRGRGGARGGGGRGEWKAERADRKEILKENSLFEGYYDSLGIYTPEEKEEFWEALRRELPNSFRFTGSKSHALQVQHRLRDYYIPQITSIEYEGQQVEPPSPLPWFPDQLAWQMTTPKAVVRRFPPFASFQKFLVSETSVGNISRQEVVSMIPPLLLDIRPGMTVLDLCAAPGSKSAQLIEMVHGGEESRIRKVIRDIRLQEGREISPEGEDTKQEMQEEETRGDWTDDGRTTGLLIANDVDWKRAHMLVHQMKRLNSPNLLVTNHDATQFPSIKLRSEPAADGRNPRNRYLKFDRILADVPCSGDGTARKNFNVWRDWTPVNGLGLHLTQVRILVRSLQMLKVGGRVVYSTCSMNPIENEAVVAATIDRCGLDKVDLIDCSSMLPGLRRSPGLKTWRVLSKDRRYWSNWADVQKHKEEHGEANLGKISESVFPLPAYDSIPLERCMRVSAHYQDTGAFFIAVLEKKSEIRARPENTPAAPTAASAPISAIINELDAKPNGAEPSEHIVAADSIVPPAAGSGQVDDATPAMIQNEDPDLLVEGPDEKKRKAANDGTETPNKRVATDEGINTTVGTSTDRQQVHYPPPPAAQLEGTAHDEDYTPNPPERETSRGGQTFEEPFKYLNPDNEALESVYKFYGISDRFPRDRYVVRNAAGLASKKIYYTSALAKEILTENEGKGLKFVHAGVTMFVRQDVPSKEICRWRIQLDGLPLMDAWVSEDRVIRLHNKSTLKKLLLDMFPKLSYGAWEELGEVGPQARDIQMGCCVLRVEKGEGDDAFSERMVFPLWRGLHSLNLMLPKEDRKALLLRIYNDDSPLQDTMKDRKSGPPSSIPTNGASASSEQTPTSEGKATSDDVVLANSDEGEEDDTLLNDATSDTAVA